MTPSTVSESNSRQVEIAKSTAHNNLPLPKEASKFLFLKPPRLYLTFTLTSTFTFRSRIQFLELESN
jgi:hypothetical protein